eukprot:COSAG06_NODE_43915_length_368_cov_0.319703_1_plen_59_part_00
MQLDGGAGVAKLKPTNLEAASTTDEPPQEFLCPISQQLMRDPVFTDAGHTYERSDIER